MSKARRMVLLVLATVGITVLASTSAAADAAAPPNTPTAVHMAGVRTVGPLFFSSLAKGHGCTASVVHSPRRDLILTAAHCVSGNGAGILFAPGYVDGHTPEGVWTTTKVWVDPRWVRLQDPQRDFAFLEVAPLRFGGRWHNVEDVTGGEQLGFTPRVGTTVSVPAYPAGVDDAPIDCTARTSRTTGYPTFDCFGYFGGTSGSPFLVSRPGRPSVVVGVIGGLHQGGCYDWNSFSSVFATDTFLTYARAALDTRGDLAPRAGSDGC